MIQTDHRDELYRFLRSNGIFAQVHYIPVHLHPYYKQFGWTRGDFPVAEAYYDRALSLPMYPSLSAEDQEYVIARLIEFSQKQM